MTEFNYEYPTLENLYEIEKQAQQLRAQATAEFFRAVVKWLAHPSFGLRHA
jgi:hypothetical protein